MPPGAQPLPDGPNGAPTGWSTLGDVAEGGEEGGEDEDDLSTGHFGLTYPMPDDDDDDSRHAHYFRAYVWMQADVDGENNLRDAAYHVDVDLTREDRLWAIDIARGNKAPRLKEAPR